MDKPKLKIFNLDGTVTEVEPNKMWSPTCKHGHAGWCAICSPKYDRKRDLEAKGGNTDGT